MDPLKELQLQLQKKAEEVMKLETIIFKLTNEITQKESQIKKLALEVEALKKSAQKMPSFSKKSTSDIDACSRNEAKSQLSAPTYLDSQAEWLKDIENEAKMKKFVNPKVPLKKTKRLAVSAESAEFQPTSTAERRKIMMRIGKTTATKEVLSRALQDNELLQMLDTSQIKEVVDCMHPIEFTKDSLIIKEGSQGSLLFAIEDGSVEILKDNKALAVLGSGKIFGEIAILYNCERTASAKALSACKVWAIERKVFQAIMMTTTLKKQEDYTNFLLSVPVLNSLSMQTISKIVDVLEEVRFDMGEYIIRQNQPGDTFYIISEGSVMVTKQKPGEPQASVVCTLNKGQFFGQLALETEEKRSANIIACSYGGVTCLVLEREAYKQLIGKTGYLRPSISESVDEETFANKEDTVKEELSAVKLSDLSVKATIGLGGFGRVEMVVLKRQNKSDLLALKRMTKSHIVRTAQQEHVMNEKHILSDINCFFIVKLYKTYKDSKFLYLLMELGRGGELWSLLRAKTAFDSQATRFYIACVVEALAYLHQRRIIFRDIKPENLILDEKGYVKLIDFGFAKKLRAGQKTFTFCGTPEYVSPEVILNKGHDSSTDLWSLGILVFELHTGNPPFNGQDHMKTYKKVLKGIDLVQFPKTFNKLAQQLVKQLCRYAPNERLGCNSVNMKVIRKHMWFDGFNWDGLISQTISTPHQPKLMSETCLPHLEYPVEDEVEAVDDWGSWDKDF